MVSQQDGPPDFENILMCYCLSSNDKSPFGNRRQEKARIKWQTLKPVLLTEPSSTLLSTTDPTSEILRLVCTVSVLGQGASSQADIWDTPLGIWICGSGVGPGHGGFVLELLECCYAVPELRGTAQHAALVSRSFSIITKIGKSVPCSVAREKLTLFHSVRNSPLPGSFQDWPLPQTTKGKRRPLVFSCSQGILQAKGLRILTLKQGLRILILKKIKDSMWGDSAVA